MTNPDAPRHVEVRDGDRTIAAAEVTTAKGAVCQSDNAQLVDVSTIGGKESFYQGLPSVAAPRAGPYDAPLSPGFLIGITSTCWTQCLEVFVKPPRIGSAAP